MPATKRKASHRTPRRNAKGKFTRRRVAAHRTRTKPNPTRRRTRRKAVANTHRRRTRRSNPKVIVRYRTRRANRRRKGVRRRSNPDLFGARLGSKASMKMIGGGIAGVALTKFVPTLIPSTMMPSLMTTNLGRTAVSFAAALVSGFLASKVDREFGQGVYFGGLLQAVSVGLNAFLPAQFGALGTGLGDFAPGRFVVPQNPLRVAAPASSGHLPAASGARVTMSGLARAYAPAY